MSLPITFEAGAAPHQSRAGAGGEWGAGNERHFNKERSSNRSTPDGSIKNNKKNPSKARNSHGEDSGGENEESCDGAADGQGGPGESVDVDVESGEDGKNE